MANDKVPQGWASTDDDKAPAAAPTINGAPGGWASTADEVPYDLTNKDSQGNPLPVYKAAGVGQQLLDVPKGVVENLAESGKGLIDVGIGLYNTLAHPYETFVEGEKGVVKGLANVSQAQDALRLKAIDAFHRGDYGAAAAHALHYLLPIVGPQLDEAGEMAANGEWGRSIGNTLGIAGQFAAPEMLKGSAVPLSPRIQVRNTLNPVEASSQAWLDSEGVPTSLSMQTGSKVARNLEGSVQNDIGGAGYAAAAKADTMGNFKAAAQRKLDQVAPGGSVTEEQAGAGVLGKIRRDIAQADADANQAYSNAWKLEKDPANVKQVPKQVRTSNGWETVEDPNTGQPVMESMPLPVDMRPMKMALRPIAAQYARTLTDTQSHASLGLKTMRDMLSGPDFKPVSQAEMDLGLLKKAARTEKGLKQLRTESQGLAAFSVGQFQQDIDSTIAGAQGGQQGLADLQAGRAATAKKWGIYEQARKFGSPNIEDLEPVSVYRKLTGENDVRINFLRRVRAMAPAEMPKVGRAFLEGLLDRAFREGRLDHQSQVLNQWDKLGQGNKLVLFRDPAMVQQLDDLFVSLKRLAAEPNPSGSGYIMSLNNKVANTFRGLGVAFGAVGGGAVGGGLGLVAGEGMHVIANGALARLLYNPKFTAMLRNGIQLELKGDKIGASLAAAQLVKLAGKDAERVGEQQERPRLSTFEQ